MSYSPGPYDRKFHQLVWGGALPGGESWCCSLKLAGEGDFTNGISVTLNNLFVTDMTDEARMGWLNDDIVPAVKTYHSSVQTGISPQAILQYVKLNPVGENGRYLYERSFEVVFPNVYGGAAYQPVANQVALAVSLTTAVSRGPGHRGRFYLPMPCGAMLGGSGMFTAQYCDDLKATTKTFLEEIADIPGLDQPGSGDPVVMSRKAGSPRTRRITGVEIGRVPDTQRRRRRSLVENYTGVAVDFGLL